MLRRFVLSALVPLIPAAAAAGEFDFFEKNVRPVLADHCYECHSAARKKAKGGLLLDSKAGWEKGGDSGPAIVPGAPEKSLLITAIGHADEDLRMPKEKLADHEIAELREWVRMGAPDPRTGDPSPERVAAFDWENERQHWAFRPVAAVQPPAVRDEAWVRNDIDRFILAKLEGAGLAPAEDAEPRTRFRRLCYDLTGLPPAPEQMSEFLADTAPDAWAKAVDRLLESPRCGERWGRHWMDLVRYADTAGDNSDFPIPQAFRYRNYIIDAFNADKPFDEFIREQIAGDLLPARDQAERNEHVVATGYLAMSRRFGSVVDRYPAHLTIEDTIENLGRTFLGLTVSCARCHDHKFDAIEQRDYYALYGMFASTRYAFPGIELLQVQKDFTPLLAPEEMAKTFGPFQQELDAAQARHDRLAKERKDAEDRKSGIEEAIGKSASGEEKAKLGKEVEELNQRIEKVRGQVKGAAKAIEDAQKKRPAVPDAYAVRDESQPADVKVQLKGDPDRLGAPVPRGWLHVLGGQTLTPDEAKTSGRRQLADWIADAENPLTARVFVNRVWQYHFGTGLVATPSDFGKRGQPPSHPELLDWLAERFVAGGWSVKKLHRLILASHAYSLSSAPDGERAEAHRLDPDNRLHWRFDRRRLEAEELRDTVLAIGGSLNGEPLREPHPFPPPAKWKYTQHHPFRDTYESSRRSVYLMSARLNNAPFFQTFDGPDRNATTASRDSSVTTLQALYFLNDSFLHREAERFAGRIMREGPDFAARLDRAFALALQRPPTAEESTRIGEFFDAVQQRAAREGAPPADRETSAAWASFTRALLRTNEFLYVD